ncbi:MAG TPA: BON domain-containing protein [Longimicrobiales bacterium]|nr:BON domain-containing protein [Longimicrobiales bacterium]
MRVWDDKSWSDAKDWRVWLAAGALTGLAAGIGVLVARRWRAVAAAVAPARWGRTAQAVRDLLRQEQGLDDRDIAVVQLADGIVELWGAVGHADDARRAMAVAQRAEDVRTVLNRLRVRDVETHLDETRRRFDDGAADLHETQWHSTGRGMHRRVGGNGRTGAPA